MIQPAFEILNQRGTPMFFSDVFANRPSAGIVGRIFISTDTKEFYRDTGTTWELLGGPGAGTITGSGTTGRLSKFTSSSSIGDSIVTEGTSLINITGTNSRLAIGGTDDGSSQFQTYYDGQTRWKFVAASNVSTDDADITGYKSRGTIAAPLAIQNGDAITNYSGRGYNGTAFVGGGGFDIFAAENYSVGANGTYIAIETTPIGSATNTYFHRFSANGGLHVGQNSDPATGYTFQTTGNSFISGRMDVNNSTADNQLRVSGSSSPSIRLDNALTAATQRFAIGLSTATNNFIQGSTAGDICITTASASPMLFGMWQTINASEVMRISTANNLLIGTTTDAGYKLDVNGTGNFNGILSATNADIYSQNGTGTNLSIGFKQSNSVKFRLRYAIATDLLAMVGSTGNFIQYWDQSGNIGIGVTPSAWSIGKAIQFTSGSIWSLSTSDMSYLANANYDGSFKYVNNTGALRYFQDATTSSHQWFIAPSGTAGNAITFTQALTLNSSGNLQLGTTSGGNWRFLCYQNASSGSATSSSLMVRQDGTDDVAQFWVSGSNIGSIKSTGNLLLGTTVDVGAKLIVNGFSRFDRGTLTMVINPSYGGSNVFSQIQSSSNLQIATGGDNNRIYITSGGNVLINSTVDQGQRLYLNGSFRIDGQTSGTAGGSSGQHLIINCDGVTYKIALLNN